MFGFFKKKAQYYGPPRYRFDYIDLPEYFWKLKSEFFTRLEQEREEFFHQLMVNSYECDGSGCKPPAPWCFAVRKHQIDESTEAITVKYDSLFDPLNREDVWSGDEVGGRIKINYSDDPEDVYERDNHSVSLCDTYIFLRQKNPSGKYEMRYWAVQVYPGGYGQDLICFRNPAKVRGRKYTDVNFWICTWNNREMDQTLNFVKWYSEDIKFRNKVERRERKFGERRKLAWEETLCEG